MGSRSYEESVREEGTGEDKRYWISRNKPVPGLPVDGTDIWALKNNYISITPMQMSLGHDQQTPEVESIMAGISDQLLKDRAR